MSATPVSISSALATRSARTLAAVVIGALLAGVAVARYAAGWWLVGVLAFGVAAAALAASADQWRGCVQARGPSRYEALIVALTIYRACLALLALASAILFVLIGVALAVGSIGVGG